jgi:tetratricopeptide (TPR) repeat protein
MAEDFSTLEQQADALRDQSLYNDALRFYERAFKAAGGSEVERLWVRYWMGDCLEVLGRYSEALTWLGELYVETRNRPEMYELAFRALFVQVEAFRHLQRSEGIETEENLHKRLEVIDEGRRWLRDIGRETWRPALLLARADALESLGDLEGALDAAEEAFRVQKDFDPPGFSLGNHATSVARFARQLKRYDRALEMLDEMNGRTANPLDALGVEVELVRTLKAMGPSRRSEALHAARRLQRIADQLQSNYDKLLGYAELAEAAAAANSLEESRSALTVVWRLAAAEQSGDRGTMLREASRVFGLLKDRFPDFLPAWKAEIDQMLKGMNPSGAAQDG